jgi:type I restriction-modification system DNA methylase subunit
MGDSSFIWLVADLRRDDYRQSEYSKVTLRFTVSRQMECALAKNAHAHRHCDACRVEQAATNERLECWM